MSVIIDSIADTRTGLEFYKLYKDIFGEIVEANMTYNDKEGYLLTLLNRYGEYMAFDSSFSAGYCGEGCRGTVQVLQMSGFNNIDLDFVSKNKTFNIRK